jgi:Tol biopolymer transport system component
VVSPDGSRIAFTRKTKDGRTDNDIYITRADGSSTSLVLGGPASDLPLAWMSDGAGLVIRSERTGGVGLWLLSLDGDKLKGPPQLLRGNMADVQLFGLSRAGSLLYQTGARQVDFNLATVDFESGRVVGIEQLEAPAGASSISPLAWSPDGHRLAYATFVEGRRALALKADNRTRDQVYYFDFNPESVGGATWSPDGRSLIIGGTTRSGRIFDLMSMYRIDLGSGAAEPLFPPVLEFDREKDLRMGITAVSPDGRFVYMYKGKMSSPGFALWKRDLAEDKEIELYRPAAPSGIGVGGPSPDGKWLPFMLSPIGGDERHIMVLPTAGGPPIRLATRTGGWGVSFAWSPDSKWLLWAQGREEGTEVWAVPIAGGEARKLAIQAHTFFGLAVHPDGKRIAYAETKVSNEEIWLLENFLPKTGKR